MRFSMAGDDCSLHFNLDELTDKQSADHRSNQVLTAMLQVALLYIGKTRDEVCLYEAFDQAPWREAVQAYHDMFTRLGLDPLPLRQIRYHPMERFYESVAAATSDTACENLYMTSRSNYALHQDNAALGVSQNLNSKIHFAAHAPAAGLPVPATLHCRKAELDSEQVSRFMQSAGTPLMLKTLGLAGARNVTAINCLDDAKAYVTEYAPDMDIILQARLDPAQYTEMTVDLFVSETDIHVTNVRQILFAEGLWVGNLLGGPVHLPQADEEVLLQVGAYAREHGYVSPAGFNLGIDYFVAKPGASADLAPLMITEINARWTGGLFPAELVRRLGVAAQPVVAFIDMCPPSRFQDYLSFLDSNLYDGSSAFGMAPMGFSPYATDVEGTEYLFVWQIVIGDFEAFKQAKEKVLGADVLISAPIISTGL